MSGKNLFPTEGSLGGIQAGSPFLVPHYTFVSSAVPPFIASGRLTQQADPEQSITAPGVLAGAGSFVLGNAVIDNGGLRAILIGDTITQAGDVGTSQDQLLIGSNFGLPATALNSSQLVAIGSGLVFTVAAGHPSFGGSVVIGSQAKLTNLVGGDASNNVVIGQGAEARAGESVVIGQVALGTDAQAIAIGVTSSVGVSSVGIGFNASAGSSSGNAGVAIGANARSGTKGVAIGFGATNSGSDSSIAIGLGASTFGSANDALAIGTNATHPNNNLALIGGSAPNGFTTIVMGQGTDAAVGGVSFVWRTTGLFGGAGNNLAGNGLTLRAGFGTGNWPNTVENLGLDFQVGIAVAAGSTTQTYTSVLALRHSDLNAAFWGGLTAPFSAGKGVLFLKNAAVNPTVAGVAGGGILSVQGGNLHWLNSAGFDAKLTPFVGGAAVLVGGTITVNTTVVSAVSRIFLTSNVPGGTIGSLSVSSRVAGTSFTILSSSALDTSTVAWLLVEPG